MHWLCIALILNVTFVKQVFRSLGKVSRFDCVLLTLVWVFWVRWKANITVDFHWSISPNNIDWKESSSSVCLSQLSMSQIHPNTAFIWLVQLLKINFRTRWLPLTTYNLRNRVFFKGMVTHGYNEKWLTERPSHLDFLKQNEWGFAMWSTDRYSDHLHLYSKLWAACKITYSLEWVLILNKSRPLKKWCSI